MSMFLYLKCNRFWYVHVFNTYWQLVTDFFYHVILTFFSCSDDYSGWVYFGIHWFSLRNLRNQGSQKTSIPNTEFAMEFRIRKAGRKELANLLHVIKCTVAQIKCTYTKARWKNLFEQAISEYWLEKVITESASKSSLKFMIRWKSHLVWHDAGFDIMSVHKAGWKSGNSS